MKRQFLHQVSALFEVNGRNVKLSVPCFMTFDYGSSFQVKSAKFNPQSQSIEIKLLKTDPREKFGQKNNEDKYI